MNLSRCSSLAVLLTVLALVLVSAVGPVAAVTADATDVPDRQEVGQERRATFTLTDLYEDGTNEFTLRGTTRLENVSWTVRKVTLNGDRRTETYTGGSFETTVSAAENTERVEVVVAGRAPSVENFSYDPAQSFEFARLAKAVGDNVDVVGTWSVTHYTAASAEARSAIETAEPVVAGSGSGSAEQQLRRARQAYDGGEFDLAAELAADAESTAASARQSRGTTQLLLFAGVGVVAVALVVGAVLYLRGGSDPGDPLG
jgi:hypothetical protein